LLATGVFRTVGAVTVQPRAFAGRPGEGQHLVFGGTTIIVRASAEMTGGAFTMFEEAAPLLDTSRHVHRNEDELYYVVEGEHVYQCGDQEFQVGPGGLVFLPRGVPHAHRRVVPQVGRLIFMTFPGGFEGFFRILAEASRVGDLGEAASARASQEYGITWVDERGG
jgi:mannose-6-phosphate isomerase-like protein (cupin superfamily)